MNKKGKGPAKGTPKYTQAVLDLMKDRKITKSKLIQEIENGNVTFFDILPLLHKIHPDYQKILLEYIPQVKKQFLIDEAKTSENIKKLLAEGKISKHDIDVRKNILKPGEDVLAYAKTKKDPPMISMFKSLKLSEKDDGVETLTKDVKKLKIKKTPVVDERLKKFMSSVDIEDYKKKKTPVEKLKDIVTKKRKTEGDVGYTPIKGVAPQLAQWQIENKIKGINKPLSYSTKPKDVKTEPRNVKKLGAYFSSKGEKTIFLSKEPKLGDKRRKRSLSSTASTSSSLGNISQRSSKSSKDSGDYEDYGDDDNNEAQGEY